MNAIVRADPIGEPVCEAWRQVPVKLVSVGVSFVADTCQLYVCFPDGEQLCLVLNGEAARRIGGALGEF